ncbi:thioredoxin family protein [Insulibacter thermoxylanivorax]|jgi:thiol-disulfide isomerase/thioredoxin|uniref:Thioredoxin family protein n=1 Tax=Insulibacter thermoxylanivorax TaxID=2749268 RepID=A0A916VFU4_9BACL|nr:thioredoxin family protein [Insulibacter thermoxylanivorax]GFR38258.1 thioredoxin family protein [Insulibacter thermoxylanivorax]
MAQTPSNMIPLGTQAPDFTLKDVVSGEKKSLSELKSDRATVIMFICNHCPFVKHVLDGLLQLANDYIPRGISFIAINSNDVEAYPDDSPENMKKLAEEKKFPFVYLFDETQEVAKAYQAACTPDFYIFDGSMKLVYRGQLDDSRPGNEIPVTGKDIRAALDAILAGEPVSEDQKPSIGCNIKWKA